MKKIYVLLYQGEVDGVFASKKAIEQFRKDNEIEKNVFEEEFEAIKTSLYEK